MNKVALISTYILGLIYFIFGLNGFLGFISPPPPSAEGGAFLGALAATGYMFPFIKITEIAGGLALLAGKFRALALIILAPVTLNIVLYHSLLDPGAQQLFLPLVILVTHLVVAYSMKDKYASVLKA